MLPADSHVHTEFSWDATDGSMERTCARAVELGLPAVSFTEHADWTVWAVAPGPDTHDTVARRTTPDGRFLPPPLDLDGYLESVERCRGLFPGLRIFTGVELGEAHWNAGPAARLVAEGRFERRLGSLHSLPVVRDGTADEDGDRVVVEVHEHYRDRPPAEVMREYLTEVHRLVTTSDLFAVLAHIDYAARSWPHDRARFDPLDFEAEFRLVLRALAESGRALEVNTTLPLAPVVLRWWRDAGGGAVTFGSDAHSPEVLASGFAQAAAMAEAIGFRPGRHPFDVWFRPA